MFELESPGFAACLTSLIVTVTDGFGAKPVSKFCGHFSSAPERNFLLLSRLYRHWLEINNINCIANTMSEHEIGLLIINTFEKWSLSTIKAVRWCLSSSLSIFAIKQVLVCSRKWNPLQIHYLLIPPLTSVEFPSVITSQCNDDANGQRQQSGEAKLYSFAGREWVMRRDESDSEAHTEVVNWPRGGTNSSCCERHRSIALVLHKLVRRVRRWRGGGDWKKEAGAF